MDEETEFSGLKRFISSDPKVVRRWWRFWAIRNGRTIARRISKRRILRDAKANTTALIDAYEATLRAYRGAERLNLTHSMAVHRAGIYFLTANRDISSFKVDLLTSNDWWHRKLLARIVALMIYELDMQKVTGANFRAAINYFAPPKKLKRDLDFALGHLATVHTEIKSKLNDIRNYTIAHRDADAMRQYRIIRNIDELEIAKLAGDFFAAANPVVPLLAELVKESGGMHHVLNQFVGNKRFKKPAQKDK